MDNARILLVDDDRLVLATLALSLRRAGFALETAEDGEGALALAGAGHFDLAVLDVRMPGMDGIELARRLRDAHGLPALFMSAYADLDLVHRAVREGGLGYLVKPVDTAQLIPALEAALARARDLAALMELKGQLERALAGGRYTSTAVGVMMERRGLTQRGAFELLRGEARARRVKLEDLARGMVEELEGQERRLG